MSYLSTGLMLSGVIIVLAAYWDSRRKIVALKRLLSDMEPLLADFIKKSDAITADIEKLKHASDNYVLAAMNDAVVSNNPIDKFYGIRK